MAGDAGHRGGSLTLDAPPRRAPWLARPAWQIAVAVLAVVIAVVMAVPSTRAEVLDFLGFSSVRIEHREPAPSRFGQSVALGDPVSLEQARRRAGFPLRVPAALGRPDAVYLDEHPSYGSRVDMTYRPRPGLPASGTTGVGLLVTELRATATPVIEKTLGAAATLRAAHGRRRSRVLHLRRANTASPTSPAAAASRYSRSSAWPATRCWSSAATACWCGSRATSSLEQAVRIAASMR